MEAAEAEAAVKRATAPATSQDTHSPGPRDDERITDDNWQQRSKRLGALQAKNEASVSLARSGVGHGAPKEPLRRLDALPYPAQRLTFQDLAGRRAQ